MRLNKNMEEKESKRQGERKQNQLHTVECVHERKIALDECV